MKKKFTHHLLLWVIPLLILMTPPSASAGHDQQILDREVSLDLKDVSLSVALTQIESVADVKFVYSPSQIDLQQIVSVAATDKKLGAILNDLLGPLGISYNVDRGKEFILLKPQKAQVPHSMRADKENVETSQANQIITGGVTDAASRQPIAGVNVVVKGTTSGTTTDSAGKYIIEASSQDILVFSFIGYKKFETQVADRLIIDVSLEQDVASLKEVVVNGGYYEVSKDLATMNIGKVTAKDIERQQVTSPLMALQSRIPGLDITPYNGSPGAAVQVQIRGQNSLRGLNGGRPLYVIDGVPVDATPIQTNSTQLFSYGIDPLSTINPSTIESIEVLKDAGATAIYGSRGANGVILITTKHGTTGRTSFDIDISKGIGTLPRKVDLLNTRQYIAMRREAFTNDDALSLLNGELAAFTNPDLVAWDTTRYTDWQKVLLGDPSSMTDMHAAFSGGDENTTFRLGGEYYRETTIYPGDFAFTRYNADVDLNHRSSNGKLQVRLSLNYGTNNSTLGSESGLILQALTLPPNAPALYNPDGTLNWQELPYAGVAYNTWVNPLSLTKNTHDSRLTTLVSNSLLSYEIIAGLNVKASLGYTELNQNEYLKRPISARPPYMASYITGTATSANNQRKSWVIEPQLNWKKDIADSHFDIILGGTYQGADAAYFSISGTMYSSDVFLNSIRLAPQKEIDSDNSSQYRYAAVFTRVGYNFRNKYLLDVAGRRDGSSRFGPDKQFGNFGSLGVAWIFSEENWIKNSLPFLTFGKIRSSYGITGNDQTGDYLFLDLYTAATTTYQGTISLIPNGLFNPDLAWEETNKFEISGELRFFNDMLSMDVSRYIHTSSNQLVSYPLPMTTGFAGISDNLDAVIENTGWELALGTRIINHDSFDWDLSANLTIPRNKLVKFDRLEESPYATRYKVGEPLTIQRSYVSNGVNPETGFYEIADINLDGTINSQDQTFNNKWLGRKFYGGVSTSFRLSNFDLSMLFQFTDFTTNGIGTSLPLSYPGTMANQQDYVLDRWQNEGDVSEIGKFSQSSSNQNLYGKVTLSDIAIKTIQFVRLKTLSLSFTLPDKWTGNVLHGASIYLQAQNLLTFGDYAGFDPETGMNLPPLRIISLGMHAKL